jgi:hypothetical protein
MKKLLIFTLTLSLIGCKEPMDKNFETIKDNYKVGYNNSSKPTEIRFVIHDKSAGMMAVIVNEKIKRIGSNDRFAIIERVGNYLDPDAVALDSLIIRYYIIDMTRKPNIEDTAYYFKTTDYNKFLTKKNELGITDLDFTKEFKVN